VLEHFATVVDPLLQNFAINGVVEGRGLHWFPFPLNLSLLRPFSLNLSIFVPHIPS
jgi:hypothetical protein